MQRGSWLLFAVAVISGCAGTNGDDGRDGRDGEDGVAVELRQLSPGKECANGGVLIELSDGSDSQILCNGKNGEMGAQGPVGAGLTAKRVNACTAVTSLPNSGTSVSLYYKQVLFSDGSVLVLCSATTNGSVSADAADFYLASQMGAVSGGCQLVSDGAGTANRGWWSFEIGVGAKPRATYHDPGTSDDQAFYAFTPANCQAVSM